MYQVLSKNVVVKDGIDDIFEKLYESDNNLESKNKTEFYAKEVKGHHHHHHHEHEGHSHGHDDRSHAHEGAIGFTHAHVMKREVK